MKIKPYPPPPRIEPSVLPTRLDLTDVETILACCPGATITFETRHKIYDGVEDVARCEHSPFAMEKMFMTFAEGDELTIVPALAASSEKSRAAEPLVRNILRHKKRPALLTGSVIGVLAALTSFLIFSGVQIERFLDDPTVTRTVAAAELALFPGLLGFGAVAVPMKHRNVLVPWQRKPSFVRRNMPTLIGGIGAVLIGAILATLSRLFI